MLAKSLRLVYVCESAGRHMKCEQGVYDQSMTMAKSCVIDLLIDINDGLNSCYFSVT